MTVDNAHDAVPLDSLPNRLVLARAYANHLSIREASMRCGIGRGSWQNWERGIHSPRHDDLLAIAEGLGVSLRWLTEGGPLPPAARPTRGRPLPRLDSNQEPADYRLLTVLADTPEIAATIAAA